MTADVLRYTNVTLRDGRQVKALVEHAPDAPVSRLQLIQMLSGCEKLLPAASHRGVTDGGRLGQTAAKTGGGDRTTTANA